MINATNKRISGKGETPEIWGLAVYDTGKPVKSGDEVVVTNRWGATSLQRLGDKVMNGKVQMVVPSDPAKGTMGYSLWYKAELGN